MTTTPEEALQKVKEALEHTLTEHEGLWIRGQCEKQIKQALALIPIIEGAMLPDLPDGWSLHSLICDEYGCDAKITKPHDNCRLNVREANGPSPRAAVLAAKEEVMP